VKVAVAWVGLAAMAFACSKVRSAAERSDGSVATVLAAAPSRATAAGEPPGLPMATVKLIDAGKAPRRKLRYAWRPGGREQLVMDLLTTVSARSDDATQPEIPLPAVHVVVGIEPGTVSTDGEMQYAWRIESTDVPTSDPKVPRRVADGMKTEVSMIERLSGSVTVTAQGIAKDIAIAPESVSDGGGTGQMVEQMRQTLRDLAAPFPQEEVGVGAKWQKLSALAGKDSRVNQSETFTLEELAGTRGALDDVLAQTAPPQLLRGPTAPLGAQPRMESMLASGDAKIRFDLAHLVPQTTFDGMTTMIVSGQSPDDTGRRMTMVMRMGIILSGSAR